MNLTTTNIIAGSVSILILLAIIIWVLIIKSRNPRKRRPREHSPMIVKVNTKGNPQAHPPGAAGYNPNHPNPPRQDGRGGAQIPAMPKTRPPSGSAGAKAEIPKEP